MIQRLMSPKFIRKVYFLKVKHFVLLVQHVTLWQSAKRRPEDVDDDSAHSIPVIERFVTSMKALQTISREFILLRRNQNVTGEFSVSELKTLQLYKNTSTLYLHKVFTFFKVYFWL